MSQTINFYVPTASIGDDSHIKYRLAVKKVLAETNEAYEHFEQKDKSNFCGCCGAESVHVFTTQQGELYEQLKKLTSDHGKRILVTSSQEESKKEADVWFKKLRE